MTEPYKPKLIEVALPLAVINEQSGREKSIRHGHPSTLHQWWARRPLAAARAVLWASLVDDPSGHADRFPTTEDQQRERDRLFDILERLVPWEATGNDGLLAEAKAEIDRCFSEGVPPVLDPFGGGGAIPLEAQRLGLASVSGDLNPVAVLIQKAMIEIAPRFSGLPAVNPSGRARLTTWSGAQGLASDVETYGQWMGAEAKRRIGDRYPKISGPGGELLTPIAWIWARTVVSPDPSWSGHVPLVKSWILARRPGKPTIWVRPVIDRTSQTISYEIERGGTPEPGNMSRGNGVCLATGSPIHGDYIKSEASGGRLGQHLIAIVADGDHERLYLKPDAHQILMSQCDVPAGLPVGKMSDHPQYMGTPRYGLDEWAKLFTPRQLLALTTFSALLDDVGELVRHDAVLAGLVNDDVPLSAGGAGAQAYADAITTYLAFAIDKATNMWSNLVSWMNDRGAFREVFARQAIPMVWDFAEANPFFAGGGGWHLFVDKIQKAVAALPSQGSGEVKQRDASALIKEVGTAAICTDPPYYDNVPYADLSDFFYVWLRRNLSKVWPDETATLLTPKNEELVADQRRFGSRRAGVEHFEQGMAKVFAEIANAQHPDVPATLFYAFKQSEDSSDGRTSTGWETFLQGLLDADLVVTATWPVRTESPGRIRATGSNALASSIVLACRPRSSAAGLETRGGLVDALRSELPEALRLLQSENVAPVDLAQSAIGPGMRVFSRYAKVVEADGSTMSVRTALALINEVLGEVLSAEEAELDPDSRFALTWFEQYAHNPGPFGDADVLARAKDTSVGGVVEAGIAVSRDGKLRLIERDELSADWSPLTDARATVWESTQHLIRRLDSSESEAAQLLNQLGGVADRARQLAYLLYGVCERKGWTEEAIAYNGLIAAWPDLARVAGATSAGPDQQALI